VCLSGNYSGIEIVDKLGIERKMIIECIQKDNSVLNDKLKSSFMRLFKVLYIDYDVY